MVLMSIYLDNIYMFNDFKVDFSYPKKIVNSTIKDEFLTNKPNFRYKKVNVIMGTNATGKTSLGKAMMKIFNFINRKQFQVLEEMKCDSDEVLKFSIDYVNSSDNNFLYRVECEYNSVDNIKLVIYKAKIGKLDSYEKAVEKLKKISDDNLSFIENLAKIKVEGWSFNFPEDNYFNIIDTKIFNTVLKTLDSNIDKVIKSKETEGSYIVKFKKLKYKDIIIQHGKIIDNSVLSTGTQSGINIASIITAIYKNLNGLYYCDEKFSYISSDIEIAIFSLMIDLLAEDTQLFFTTHNLDILDMNLPHHSYLFLNKDKKIEVIHPEKIVKKNDVSLKNKAKNGVFDFSTNINLIYSLREELIDEK